MERFFIVKNQELINMHRKYEEYCKKFDECFRVMSEKYDIESEGYYMFSDAFKIVPTKKDREKFWKMFYKDEDGKFQKRSGISKEWISLCKESGIDVSVPDNGAWFLSRLIGAPQSGLFENRYRYRILDIDGVTYGSYEIDRDWELTNTTDFQELKASEFWKIMEG